MEYSAGKNTTVLKADVETIRSKPGMWFGGVDSQAQTSIVWELLGNAVDLCLANQVSRVALDLPDSHSIRIQDDGPGMPYTELNQLVAALTQPHSTPTRDGKSPHVHVGGALSGVGLATVAAVCSRFELTSLGPNGSFSVLLEHGGVVHAERSVPPSTQLGTFINARVERSVFPTGWHEAGVHWRIFELACLCPGLEVDFGGRTLRGDLTHLFPGGPIATDDEPTDGYLETGHRLRLAFRPAQRRGRSTTIFAYLNLASIEDGSLHSGLIQGLKKGRVRTPAGILVADLWHPHPNYAGPTRDALDQPELVEPISNLVSEFMERY